MSRPWGCREKLINESLVIVLYKYAGECLMLNVPDTFRVFVGFDSGNV